MAFKGKVIHNAKTGQTLEFVTTAADGDGMLLEMISTYRPHSTRPPAHYHPFQDEHFTVLEGELTVRLNDETVILEKGYSIGIPKHVVHSMWNASGSKTIVQWKVMPALKTEFFLEALMDLSNHDKTGDSGKPPLSEMARLAQSYSREFRLAKPPYVIQKLFFRFLSSACNSQTCKNPTCLKKLYPIKQNDDAAIIKANR